MISAFKISGVAIRMWSRELERILRVSRGALLLLSIAMLVVTLGLGAGLAALTLSQIDGDLPPALAQSITRTSLAGVVTTTGLLSALFALTVPSHTALQTLINTLPVSRASGLWGQLLPTALLTFVFSLALSISALWLLVKLTWDERLLAGPLVVILCIAITQVIVVGLFHILSSLLRSLLHLATSYAQAFAAVILIAAVVLCGSVDIFSRGLTNDNASFPSNLLIHRSFSTLLWPDPSGMSWVFTPMWFTLAIVVAGLAGRMRPSMQNGATLPLLRGWKPRLTPTAGSFWYNVLTGVRTSQFLTVTAGTFALVAVLIWLSPSTDLSTVVDPLKLAVPVVPCLLGIYAVGRSVRSRWIEAYIAPSPLRWIITAASSYLLLSAVVGSLATIALFAFGQIAWANLPILGARMLLAWSLALLAGALIPYSNDQPVSATAGAFLAGILFLTGSLTVGFLVSSLGETLAGSITILLTIACLFLFYAVCSRHQLRVAVA